MVLDNMLWQNKAPLRILLRKIVLNFRTNIMVRMNTLESDVLKESNYFKNIKSTP